MRLWNHAPSGEQKALQIRGGLWALSELTEVQHPFSSWEQNPSGPRIKDHVCQLSSDEVQS